MGNNGYKGTSNPSKKSDRKGNVTKKVRRLQEKDFTIDLSGRHVFGAYFNMARTNFVKTINYILPIAGVRGNYAENQVNKMLSALFLIQANREKELTQEQLQWKKKLILNPEQQTRLQRLLFKHFPILRPMMADVAEHKAYLNKKKSNVTTEDEVFEQLRGISLEDCLENMLLIAQTLTECRNTYTHRKPYNTPSQWAEQYRHQDQLAKKLDKVIVASRRVLKDRESLTVNELEFLTGIDHMKQVDTLDENGQAIVKDGKKLKTFKEYEDFYFKIKGKREVEGLKMANNSSVDALLPALSDFGLLYFCVQFMSKPYAKLFMDETHLFEFSPFNDNENIVMQEMMCIYRIRPPKLHRIDSRDSKSTLTMDIFAELGRCPIELYELLNKTGQSFFHDVVKHPNSHTPDVSKRLRYTDRFPQLALRYIDENDVFKRIRFQLQLGAFRYKFYDKECIDGRPRVRRIQKNINGYGRLQEAETKRYEKWGDLIQKREERNVKLEHEELYVDLDQFVQDTADSTPYITDRRPTYNIHANRIGLYWEDSQNPNDFTLFDANLMYLPQLTVTDDEKAPVKMPAPRSTLSVYDLPAMLFYEYLRTQQKGALTSAEQIIIDYEAEYHRFFNAVADGTIKPFEQSEEFRVFLATNYPKLKMTDIPERLRMYLISKSLNHDNKPETVRQRLVRVTLDHLKEREERISRRIHNYKEDCKKIGDKTNKIGKRDFVDVRHGALARYLAQSLMEWQPTQDGLGHDKLTGLNYNVLTSYLATYGTSQPDEEGFVPRTLTQILTEAHFIGGHNPHPFIDKVLAKRNTNIEDFYLNYLNEELNHLRSRRQSLESNPTDKALEDLPFVHHTRNRYHEHTEEEMKRLATEYDTIQLPDGLFTKYIYELLTKYYADNVELQQKLKEIAPDKLNPLNNAAYLITLFYQTELRGDAQPFYHSDQTYTVINEEGKKINYSFKRAYELLSTLRNKKKDTFPYELIPYYQTSDQIQERISEKQLDEEGDPIYKLGKRGKAVTDTQGNIIWERKLKHDIDEYVYSRTDKDLMIAQNQSRSKKDEERQEKREALRKRLNHQIKDIKNNERMLRRYKTQDMVLFLLATEMFDCILTEQNREVNWDNLRLDRVCDRAFLSQTLTFQVPVTVGGKTVYVEQENMSLKNYGEFYRFLTDDRLDSLLTNIIDTLKPNKDGKLIIRHTDLMSELAAYDQQRSTVFRLIQKIEKLIIDKHGVLRKPDTPDFWVKEGLPKRNNFASLLELINRLGNVELNEEERKLLVAIRNAFSHNSYNIDLSQIQGIKKLPEVAKGILQHLEIVLGVNQKK